MAWLCAWNDQHNLSLAWPCSANLPKLFLGQIWETFGRNLRTVNWRDWISIIKLIESNIGSDVESKSAPSLFQVFASKPFDVLVVPPGESWRRLTKCSELHTPPSTNITPQRSVTSTCLEDGSCDTTLTCALVVSWVYARLVLYTNSSPGVHSSDHECTTTCLICEWKMYSELPRWYNTDDITRCTDYCHFRGLASH